MTDEQIEKALADKVMGWASSWDWGEDHEEYEVWDKPDGTSASKGLWYPLEDDEQACAVLDKMGSDGWHISLSYGWCKPGEPPWACSFEREYPGYFQHRVLANDRRRAICLAALQAAGVETEG